MRMDPRTKCDFQHFGNSVDIWAVKLQNHTSRLRYLEVSAPFSFLLKENKSTFFLKFTQSCLRSEKENHGRFRKLMLRSLSFKKIKCDRKSTMLQTEKRAMVVSLPIYFLIKIPILEKTAEMPVKIVVVRDLIHQVDSSFSWHSCRNQW